MNGLTWYEVALLRSKAQGDSDRKIAYESNLSAREVAIDLKAVREKLGAVNTMNAVYIATKKGWL